MIRPRLLRLGAVVLLLAATARAQDAGLPVPDAETQDPPTAPRLAMIEAAAARGGGWGAAVGPLRLAAQSAYRHNRFAAAEAWFHVYRWAAIFSEPESECLTDWVKAVNAYQVGYAGVSGDYTAGDTPLGDKVPDDFKFWALGHEAFSREFFTNVKAVDRLPKVLDILAELYRASPEQFGRYSSLALAIAFVYDVPPPPFWPHLQVSEAALPRRLPPPGETYARLIRADGRHETYFRLSQLPAEELKFVVDTAAPPADLAWAVQNVSYPLEDLEQAYLSIKYRDDRASSLAGMVWRSPAYTLANIQADGGICIDQAYFATEVGKARGVPTLIFGGEGQDGRHAWFGYLQADRTWKLDAGRYAEQRLVTGIAYDPQTWRPISDHELQFLSERFHALPSYLQSRVHQEFAEDYFAHGDFGAAARAARTAVNYERRNLDAWEYLLAADARLNLPPAEQEGVMREAARAFAPRYPDVVMNYANRVCQSLRARGEGSLADYEQQGLARRLLGDRNDLAVTQAAAILGRSLATQPLAGQIATYNAILAQFGHGAGTIFFDQIVVGFAQHLLQLHQKAEAREAVARAREVLEVQPATPIALEFDKLEGLLRD